MVLWLALGSRRRFWKQAFTFGSMVLTNAVEGARLQLARLDGADFTGVKNATKEQLATCQTLEDATMPNGQKYEE